MSRKLTTFEKNYDEWKANHPTRSPERWVATTDRREAARFISRKAEKIREVQLDTADDIITKQEKTRQELKSEISSGVDDIVDGLYGIKSTFEWGFSELVWQIEKQREVLKGILETLQKPLDTQAKELKKRAEKAYKNGWYDDALRDFLESEKKNPYDFTVHQTIGNIYFFHKGNPGEALEYYQRAVKYAKPESSYHASFALLHISLIKYLEEEFSEAYKATSKARRLSPELLEANYQLAKYSAKLERYGEATENLKKAIMGDIGYVLRANSDQDFEAMKDRIKSVIDELSKKHKNLAKERIKTAKRIIKKANQDNLSVDKFTVQQKIDEVSNLLSKGSLFDSKAAVKVADEAIEKARTALMNVLKRRQERLRQKKDDINTHLADFIPSIFDVPLAYLMVFFEIIFVLGVVGFGITAIVKFVIGTPIQGFIYISVVIAIILLYLIPLFIAQLWTTKQYGKEKDIEEEIEKLNNRLEEQKEKLYQIQEE